jgi:hypothetical protein
MVPRLLFFLLYFFLTSILLVLYVAEAGDEWYHHCGDNGRDCSYGQGKYARHDASCQDYHPNCRDYALRGKCIKKEGWMKSECPLSCAICFSSKLGDDDATCRDQHGQCSEWAKEDLECFVNPAYMSEACPQSCNFCVNATLLNEEGLLSTEDIQQRFLYSRTDFGIWQNFPLNSPDTQAVTETIRRMGPYAQQLETLGPATLCNNLHPTCAQWAVERGCGGDNLEFMMQECALACQLCHVTEQYYQCSLAPRNDTPVVSSSSSSSNTPFNFWKEGLFQNHEAENLVAAFSAARPDEWVASLNYTALWKDPPTQLDSLLEVSKNNSNSNLEWKNKGTGRFASCRKDEDACAKKKDEIATLLGISPVYLEPLEFVHFQVKERQTPQSEFDMHRQWKPGGHVLLTIFILLQPVEKGGALGFPDLDWLLVENPQILIWPNVANDKWNQELESMKHEQLPVVEGDLYGVYTRVRQYPYESNPLCDYD